MSEVKNLREDLDTYMEITLSRKLNLRFKDCLEVFRLKGRDEMRGEEYRLHLVFLREFGIW